MGKFKDNMNDIFGLSNEISVEVVEDNLPVIATEKPTKHKSKAVQEIHEDYEFVRQNLLDTIKHARLALDELNNIASVTEQPRAFEVYAKLIDTINEANRDLIDLHKRMKDITGEVQKQENSVTNNTLMVGSTTELVKLIEGQSE